VVYEFGLFLEANITLWYSTCYKENGKETSRAECIHMFFNMKIEEHDIKAWTVGVNQGLDLNLSV